MFLVLNEYYSEWLMKDILVEQGKTIQMCNFVVVLVDKENGKYRVLKERYGKYFPNDIISEAQVLDHCWYIMGVSRNIL